MILAAQSLSGLLAPEIILLIGAALLLLGGLRRPPVHRLMAAALLIVGAALASAVRLNWSPGAGGTAFLSEVSSGPLIFYVRVVTLALGMLILLANRHVPAEGERGEFFALILVSLAGICGVALANNLVLLFLSLELVSVPTYILIALSRRDRRAQEACGKYFFLGAFAAALTLYGFSFLYGAAGTMRMYSGAAAVPSLHSVLSSPGATPDTFVVIGLVLALAGLAFKIAAVPLHFYIADVYQGAAAPVAGLLGFVPKIAGFIALIRVLGLGDWPSAAADAAGQDAVFWLLWVLAALTMTVGNTLALMQHNVKRMLAYSGIAHSGYMLVALVAGPALMTVAENSPFRDGSAALLFYVVIYGVMNLGAFAAISFFRKPGPDDADDSVEMLSDLAGAARRHPWASLGLAVCVLGLMGFPLTAGFFGKFYVFSAALSAGDGARGRDTAMLVLVVIGVLNSAVAAAYYLRILATCYLRRPADGVTPTRCHALQLSMALCAIIALGLFFKPAVLFDQARTAAGGTTHPIAKQPLPSNRAAIP